MNPGTHDAPTHAQLEQAAEWYARLGDGGATAGQQSRWRAWLEAAPGNRRAWQYVEQVGQRFAGVRSQGPAAHDALSRARATGVSRRRLLQSLGLAATAGPLAWTLLRDRSGTGGPAQWLTRQTAALSTGVGEIRQISLEDGSRLWLDTDTAADLEPGQTHRQLRLHAGRVMVDTGARPLQVATTHGTALPRGTRFTISHDARRSRVSVFEGRVDLLPAGTARPIRIATGSALAFDATGVGTVEMARLADDAWRHGQLVADHMPLGELVETLSRYRRGHLGVAPELADWPVMGVYPLTEGDRALHMLAEALPLRVVQRWPWWTTLEARAAR